MRLLTTYINLKKNNRESKKSRRSKKRKRSRKRRKNKRKRKINNINIVTEITLNKKMERKVKKTNIKSVIDKKNNSAEGTDPDLNKRSKENAIHHLNREVVILIENLV